MRIPNHELADEEVARAVQQGSQDGLRLLLERHHRPLLGFLYRLTNGDRPLAEDMVQETMVRLLRKLNTYDSQRPFKPWLYQIAVNVTRDHYKQAETRHTQSVNGVMELIATTPRPETAVIVQESAREAWTAVHELPPHQREAVLLRYGEGLSLEEIAVVLQIPVGTVKSRLSLGLKRLREQLERESGR